MSGKKGTERTKTIEDETKLKAAIARFAKAWGVTSKDAQARCLRMGVNRYLALARAGQLPGKRGGKKRAAKKPAKKAPKRSAKPRAAARPKHSSLNGASAQA